MEAALMQPAAAATPARWRCVGDASLAGHGQQRLAGVVRLGVRAAELSGLAPGWASSPRRPPARGWRMARKTRAR